MVRATWVKPMTLVQKFEANEAVTACLEVVCESGRYGKYTAVPVKRETLGPTNHPAEKDGANPWNRDDVLCVLAGTREHNGNVCRQPNHNLVFENDGTVHGINGWWVEYSSDDDHDGIIEVGDRVYWCNDEGYWGQNFKYNHWGTVTQGSNRS